ncbi:tripartite tricarboxylate transporter substrate binding protein [Oligella ureolytica]
MKSVFVKKVIGVSLALSSFCPPLTLHRLRTQLLGLNRDIRLIVPFGAGSTPDQIARIVATEASKTLNQTIVVDNCPGAGGNIGTAAIATNLMVIPLVLVLMVL